MAHEPFLAGSFQQLTSLLSDMTKKEETFHDAKLFKVLSPGHLKTNENGPLFPKRGVFSNSHTFHDKND